MITLTTLLIIAWIVSYRKIKKLSGEKFDLLHDNVSYVQGMIFTLLSTILALIILPTAVCLIVKYLP